MGYVFFPDLRRVLAGLSAALHPGLPGSDLPACPCLLLVPIPKMMQLTSQITLDDAAKLRSLTHVPDIFQCPLPWSTKHRRNAGSLMPIAKVKENMVKFSAIFSSKVFKRLLAGLLV